MHLQGPPSSALTWNGRFIPEVQSRPHVCCRDRAQGSTLETSFHCAWALQPVSTEGPLRNYKHLPLRCRPYLQHLQRSRGSSVSRSLMLTYFRDRISLRNLGWSGTCCAGNCRWTILCSAELSLLFSVLPSSSSLVWPPKCPMHPGGRNSAPPHPRVTGL